MTQRDVGIEARERQEIEPRKQQATHSNSPKLNWEEEEEEQEEEQEEDKQLLGQEEGIFCCAYKIENIS